MNFKLASIFLVFLVCIFSCKNEREEKFDKLKWAYVEDPAFPPSHRKNMLKDLTSNYKLTGIKYSELIVLLGEPNFRDSSSIGYEVDIDYGRDIDPVYEKKIVFSFSKDSIITYFFIDEWKK